MTAEPTLPRSSPLRAWAERFTALPAGVDLVEEPFVPMTNLRATPGGPAAARVEAALGLELPTIASTATRSASSTAIWLGPDEWLVTGAADLRGPDVAVVDVSAQRTTLRLRGAHARDLLETGCAIDLHPRSFPPGSAVQTVIGGSGVILLAEEDGYRLFVRSSFAAHLAAWLEDAAVEYR